MNAVSASMAAPPVAALPPGHAAIHASDDGMAWLRLSDDRTTFAIRMNVDDLEGLGHLLFAAAAAMRGPALPENVISIFRERPAR
ncbi:MAG: hypothetical protein WDA25_01100 [Paracoccaceae bacterium]